MQVEEAYWRALQVLIRFIDLTWNFLDAQNAGSFPWMLGIIKRSEKSYVLSMNLKLTKRSAQLNSPIRLFFVRNPSHLRANEMRD